MRERFETMSQLKRQMTPAEIIELARRQATADAQAAFAAFGISEVAGYASIRRGDFPIEVIKVGRVWRVRRRDLVSKVGLEADPAEPVSA